MLQFFPQLHTFRHIQPNMMWSYFSAWFEMNKSLFASNYSQNQPFLCSAKKWILFVYVIVCWKLASAGVSQFRRENATGKANISFARFYVLVFCVVLVVAIWLVCARIRSGWHVWHDTFGSLGCEPAKTQTTFASAHTHIMKPSLVDNFSASSWRISLLTFAHRWFN